MLIWECGGVWPLSSQMLRNWGINGHPGPSSSREVPGLRWKGRHGWLGEKSMWLLRTWLLNLGRGPSTQPALSLSETRVWWVRGSNSHWLANLRLQSSLPSQSLSFLIHSLWNAEIHFKIAKYIKFLRYPGCSASVSRLVWVGMCEDCLHLKSRRNWILPHNLPRSLGISDLHEDE